MRIIQISLILLFFSEVAQLIIKQNNNTIIQYGGFNFGKIAIITLQDITFIIENTDHVNLNIEIINNNKVNLINNNSGLFNINQQLLNVTITP